MVKTELRCVGGCFELHTPCAEADKCWISYADDEEVTWMVVMAKYRPSDGDKSNEVVVPLLVEKSTSGVEITSYVDDQICFKLNRFGRIRFNHVRVPFNALMNRFVRWDVLAQKMVFEGSRRGAPPLPVVSSSARSRRLVMTVTLMPPCTTRGLWQVFSTRCLTAC